MTAHDVSGSHTAGNCRLNLFSGFQALDNDAFQDASFRELHAVYRKLG